MRELMAGAPSAMADAYVGRPRPSSGGLVAKLPGLLAKHGDLDLGADQDMVPVPQVIARAFSDVVSARVREEARNRTNAVELITAGTDDAHPAIAQWSAAYDFFVGWAHLDRNHDEERPLPSDAAISKQIKVVEDVIDVRSAMFFDNLHAIQDLLADINAIDGDDA